MIDMSGVHQAVARLTTPVVIRDAPDDSPSVSDIIAKMTSTRWRRSALDDDARVDLQAKVTDRVRANAPIEFTLPFGGYKGWDQPGAPELNWAEVMWLGHLRRYAAEIASVYAPGARVTLTYYSHALDLVNGLSASDQDRYIGQLADLAARFSDQRVQIEAFDLVALHGDVSTFRNELRAAIAAGPQSPPTAAAIASARRNYLGGDAAAVDESAVDAAARACLAMEELPPRRRFNKGEHRIQLVHIRGPKLSLHLGSSRTTIAQPWVATGFLRPHRGQLIESLTRAPVKGISATVEHPLTDVSSQLHSIVVADG